MKTTIQLSPRQLATVLFALRHVQEVLESDPDKRPLTGPHFIDHKPLDAAGIDRLCVKLNHAEPLRVIIEVSGGVVDPVHISHEAVVDIYDHDNIEAGDEAPFDLETESAKLPFTH